MGGCFSKNKKQKHNDGDDDGHEGKGEKKKASASRDPPPTQCESGSESHQEEEMVKEVLSETPKFVPNAAAARRPDPNNKKEGPSDLAGPDNVDRESSQVISECLSAASTTTAAEVEQEQESGEKKRKTRSSASPAKIRSDQLQCRQAWGGGGGRRGVDVGCRSGRPSPSPMGSAGNMNRRQISSSSSNFPSGNVVNNHKKRSEDIGERSGRRSMSPATNRSGSRGATAATATADQRANGRSLPQSQRTPAPARVADLGELGKEQEGNIKEDEANDGEGKEGETLENPLVSMECFIFL